MKKLIFLLNHLPAPNKQQMLIDDMNKQDVGVTYVSIPKVMNHPGLKEECENLLNEYNSSDYLILTDSVEIYRVSRECHISVLVYLWNMDDMNQYDGAKYFVLEAEDTEYDYFLKIWQRFQNIPWIITRTSRLIIRETVEEDVEAFYHMYQDKRMTAYTEPLYENIDDERKYIKEYREKVYECQQYGIWTLVRKADNKIIGRAGLTWRSGFDSVEIGFAVGCEYWYNGYGKEAVLAVLQYAKQHELGPVNALIMKENYSSIELVKQCGFCYQSEYEMNKQHYQVWQLPELIKY